MLTKEDPAKLSRMLLLRSTALFWVGVLPSGLKLLRRASLAKVRYEGEYSCMYKVMKLIVIIPCASAK